MILPLLTSLADLAPVVPPLPFVNLVHALAAVPPLALGICLRRYNAKLSAVQLQ